MCDSFQVMQDLVTEIYFKCSNIGTKHDFSCINICQVMRKTLHTEEVAGHFEHLSSTQVQCLINTIALI